MDSLSRMIRTSKSKPCPVCKKTDWCLIAPDGSACICKRTESGKQCGDAGWLHKLTESQPGGVRNGSQESKTGNWETDAQKFARNMADAPQYREMLATSLRLPVDALDAMPLIGYRKATNEFVEFTFPEVNAANRLLGIATRVEVDGKKAEKRFVKGGKRGLTLPIGWRDRAGPLFVVEGPIDVLAMTAAGLTCIGRPSNAAGGKLLAEVCCEWAGPIIIVGENDRKDDGAWPGLQGAQSVAKSISQSLGRPVKWVMPPADAKDVREWLTSEDRREVPWPERGVEMLRQLEANSEPKGNHDGEFDPKDGDGPEILLGVDEFRVNAQACEALGREQDIYQRGGLLVHVIEQTEEPEAEAVVRRPIGSISIRELPKPLLRERLTQCGRWVEWRGKGDDAQKVPTHPPDWSISAIHVKGEWPKVRRLEAVVTHPVLLMNGSLLSSNGFDEKSGLLLTMPPSLSVSVPDRPTREDVAAAVDELGDVIQDFPFETPEHRAAWFASLLTPLAWFAFSGPAPMFLIDANIRAAGKGLLADTVAIIVTGRRFPVMSYTNDKEELRKKITTLAVEGERLVLLDNLAGAVGNEVLDMALTSDTWKDRLLGGNRGYNGPLNVTWFATGNNVQLGADTSRRVCHIRLESEQERPETRADVKYEDLRSHVFRHRGKLLSAALTILRGWVVAGKPKHGLKPWGSFEQWSNVVREAIVFAGLPDPGETRLQLQSMADRDANAMESIIAGLNEMDSDGRGLTTSEIVKRLKDDLSANERISEMRAAVEELCGKLCGRLLGYKFRQFSRRNFGGKMIDKASAANGKNRWAIVVAGSRRGTKDTNHRNHRTSHPPASDCDGGDGGDVPGDTDGESLASSDEVFGKTDISALWL